MKKCKNLYPGTEKAEQEKGKTKLLDDRQPDYIITAAGICPNYDKYKNVDPAIVLAWLNMD